jgi:hypothetical protein
MTEERDSRASVLRDLVREAGFDSGGHPAPELLFEYQERLLTPVQAEEVQDHLALCPDCARMVLELAGTVPPAVPGAPSRLSEREMAEVWPGLRKRLPFPAAPSPAWAWAWRRPLERVALPLAAAFLAATVGLSVWSASLLRDQQRLTRPQANVAIVNLAPQGQEVLREGKRPSAVPRDAEEVLLVLNLADLRRFPTYRAEILTAADGRLLWAGDDLERSSRGNFTLRLPLSFLPPGRYRIRLFGLDGGRREPLADYEVDLAAPR